MINITLPDGSVRQAADDATALDVARDISEGLARNVLAAEVDGEVRDAQRPLGGDVALKLLTWGDDDAASTMWHSGAHLMAEALEVLYPGVKFWVGPSVEGGFYYDVDFGEHTFSDKDFPTVEKKMLELAREKSAYVRKEVPKSEAIAYFKEKGDHYKLDLLDSLEDGTITFYTQGGFTDLCRGHTFPTPVSSKRSNCSRWPERIGKGTSLRSSSPASTASPFPRRRSSTNTSSCWSRPGCGTTENSARNSTCFPSAKRWAKACPCGCPKAPI